MTEETMQQAEAEDEDKSIFLDPNEDFLTNLDMEFDRDRVVDETAYLECVVACNASP